MASFLEMADCTRLLKQAWKEWHMTKSLLLCTGVTMSIFGFWTASTLPFAQYGPWVISAGFIGCTGAITVTYSLILFWCSYQKEVERNGCNRRNASLYESNDYLLFFNNTSSNQPDVCVHAPSNSRGLFNETNKV